MVAKRSFCPKKRHTLRVSGASNDNFGRFFTGSCTDEWIESDNDEEKMHRLCCEMLACMEQLVLYEC